MPFTTPSNPPLKNPLKNTPTNNYYHITENLLENYSGLSKEPTEENTVSPTLALILCIYHYP